MPLLRRLRTGGLPSLAPSPGPRWADRPGRRFCSMRPCYEECCLADRARRRREACATFSPMSTFEERAASRRLTAVARLSRGPQSDDRAFDVAFWQAQGPEAILAAAWEMVLESRRLLAVRPDPTNAERVFWALCTFGAPVSEVTATNPWMPSRVGISSGDRVSSVPSSEILLPSKRAGGRLTAGLGRRPRP